MCVYWRTRCTVKPSNLPTGEAKKLTDLVERPEYRQHEHNDRREDAADKHQRNDCTQRPLHLLLERLGNLRVNLIDIMGKSIQNPTRWCRIEEADWESENL